MDRGKFLVVFVLTAVALCWGVQKNDVQAQTAPSLQSGQNTDYERHRESLQILQEALKAQGSQEIIPQMPTGPMTPSFASSVVNSAIGGSALYPPGLGFNPAVDYTKPNFSQSPNIRKFVDSLPGLGLPGCTPGTGSPPNVSGGTCNQNNLGMYIPVAAPVRIPSPRNLLL